jgi:hypothetical protein
MNQEEWIALVKSCKEAIATKLECKAEDIVIEYDTCYDAEDVEDRRPKPLEELPESKYDSGYNASFEVRKADNNSYSGRISYWYMKELHKCCAVVVSCGVSVSSYYQNRGFGTLLNNLRIEIAKRMGYSLMMCTDREKNVPQRKILAKNGWKDVCSVHNKRTGNNVFVSVIDLKD